MGEGKVDELPHNTFRIRWPLLVPGFQSIPKAGVEVVLKEIGEVKDGSRIDCPAAITTDGDMVPISWLVPKMPAQTSTALERAIQTINPITPEIASGSWWLGRCSAIYAGIRLSLDDSLCMGSYVVCQPCEWTSYLPTDRWAPFLLAVRTCTGRIDEMYHEWNQNEYYNRRFGEKLKKRDQLNDLIAGPPSGPCPAIAYFIIQRTAKGKFYLEQEDTFLSIDLLLEYYYHISLPVKQQNIEGGLDLVLTKAAACCRRPDKSPRPLLHKDGNSNVIYQKTSPGYPPVPNSFTDIFKYTPRIYRTPLQDDKEIQELLFKGYFRISDTYKNVSLRKLRADTFSVDSMKADLEYIHRQLMVKSTSPVNDPTLSIKDFVTNPAGSNFLAHIIAAGTEQKVLGGAWVAYQFVQGIPLDRILQKRRYEEEYMSPRHKYEIMYQIAGGMRFLENNYLCHRHLRAANVIVCNEVHHMYEIKITDYMLPYNFLREDVAALANMSTMDWPWWAPECVQHRIFDIISDIWSFGCVIFEIIHNGMAPFSFEKPQLTSNKDLLQFFEAEKKMNIIGKIEVDSFIEELITLCFNYDDTARPTFSHIFDFFKNLLFNFKAGPEITISRYIIEAPKMFIHKWVRTKKYQKRTKKSHDNRKKKK